MSLSVNKFNLYIVILAALVYTSHIGIGNKERGTRNESKIYMNDDNKSNFNSDTA